MATDSLNKPWHSYSEKHMNEHMSQHTGRSKKHAFTGYDLELTYLLGHSALDFQHVCKNRIIRSLRNDGVNIARTIEIPSSIPPSYGMDKIDRNRICYQAQNLIYMYALGLVDTLDEELIEYTRDPVVRNYGREGDKLDGDIPIFRSLIGMKIEINLQDVGEIREEYLEKRPIALEILEAAKKYGLKLNATVLPLV